MKTGYQILKEAAERMRSEAQAAISAVGEERWIYGGTGWVEGEGTIHGVSTGEFHVSTAPFEEVNEHQTGMDPAVALAVAEVLDGAAKCYENIPEHFEDRENFCNWLVPDQLALAKTYLRIGESLDTSA